jgi:cytochrome b561
MTEAIEAAEDGQPVSALTDTLADMHYDFGLIILALVAVRLVLRLRNGVPPPMPETSSAIETAGRVSHWLFYALLVVVPVTGLLGYYSGDPYGEWHALAKPVFIGLIALHVAAALYHQFWRKDGLLTRMLKPA